MIAQRKLCVARGDRLPRTLSELQRTHRPSAELRNRGRTQHHPKSPRGRTGGRADSSRGRRSALNRGKSQEPLRMSRWISSPASSASGFASLGSQRYLNSALHGTAPHRLRVHSHRFPSKSCRPKLVVGGFLASGTNAAIRISLERGRVSGAWGSLGTVGEVVQNAHGWPGRSSRRRPAASRSMRGRKRRSGVQRLSPTRA
jgi:hypothetical protein